MKQESEAAARRQLVDAGRRLYQRGLLVGTEGNLSVRLADRRIMITPAGANKSRLEQDDLVTVDSQGRQLNGNRQPSSELLMHLLIYERRLDVTACVHTHPPYATAFAAAGVELRDDVLPEIILSVGGIPLTDYAPPGTEAVPKSLEPYVVDHDAFLLRNHGLLTIGRTLEEACTRHETVEHYARIVWLAGQLGEASAIPASDKQRLTELRRDTVAGRKRE